MFESRSGLAQMPAGGILMGRNARRSGFSHGMWTFFDDEMTQEYLKSQAKRFSRLVKTSEP
jgi:hypothetical protein